MTEFTATFVSFDCQCVPLEPNTPATVRDRGGYTGFEPAVFVSFDCESVPLAPGEKAAPRPPGRERIIDASEPDRTPPNPS